VASLAGITDDAGGHLLAFAFMTDHIGKASELTAAAKAIDAMATTLAGCGCR
jgi:D-alanyl-D-alanine carboxypeptidase